MEREQLQPVRMIERLDGKITRMIGQIGNRVPHVAKEDGVYDHTPIDWWTSGFWPGMLWIMYDLTGKEHYREAAWGYDEALERRWLEPNRFHHDVGFQFLPTAMLKHELTGDADALRRTIFAAGVLAGRYNHEGRFIRAWNDDKTGWAIIDCTMNLSLLFQASEKTGDPRYRQTAIRHADTVLEHFVRPDGSVRHIVSFDPATGAFIEALGGQGFGPDSSWSRGQAWALYGLANVSRYTGDARYLDAAKRVAHYVLASLPEDFVPAWDFRAPDAADGPRDSSAGAIAASGLIEIAKLVPEPESDFYFRASRRMLESLATRYATWDRPEHQAILLQGTGHKPAGQNVNVSLIYGDYYFVEAYAKLAGWKRHVF
ncbi:glycoside hydrolase family 88 protein [Paenibacillus thermoaerophilus]|uniref:Glycoside hydrolase family 88 protein n=1 Tax=Paenibacillus thermoaerophilus TaxID=1215385 RepID=A0ABW2V571_9BACL|nr:glycoside hydrolase family 88 protein [Paenibacillus thermoaerophilus]TMV17900.1 glycosyl hydrolase [Paenibacillus thermoaerophilus]